MFFFLRSWWRFDTLCPAVAKVWDYFLNNYSHSAGNSISIEDVVFSWRRYNLSSRGRAIWKGLAHAVLWYVWCKRNQCVFKGEAIPVDRLIAHSKGLVWSRCMGKICSQGNQNWRLSFFGFCWKKNCKSRKLGSNMNSSPLNLSQWICPR